MREIRLEVYPKPESFDVHGVFYMKDNLDFVFDLYNKKISFTVGLIAYDHDGLSDIPLDKVIGSIRYIEKEETAYYAKLRIFKNEMSGFLGFDKLTECEFQDMYVLSSLNCGTIHNNIAGLSGIEGLILVPRLSVLTEENKKSYLRNKKIQKLL